MNKRHSVAIIVEIDEDDYEMLEGYVDGLRALVEFMQTSTPHNTYVDWEQDGGEGMQRYIEEHRPLDD